MLASVCLFAYASAYAVLTRQQCFRTRTLLLRQHTPTGFLWFWRLLLLGWRPLPKKKQRHVHSFFCQLFLLFAFPHSCSLGANFLCKESQEKLQRKEVVLQCCCVCDWIAECCFLPDHQMTSVWAALGFMHVGVILHQKSTMRRQERYHQWQHKVVHCRRASHGHRKNVSLHKTLGLTLDCSFATAGVLNKWFKNWMTKTAAIARNMYIYIYSVYISVYVYIYKCVCCRHNIILLMHTAMSLWAYAT